MLIDIGQRAPQALLLAVPEGEADGAFRTDAQLHQDSGGLHDHGAAGGVVAGAVGGDPAVEVGAGHDVFTGAVRARNIGQDVVGIDVLIVELDLAHQLQRRRGVGPGEAGEAAIVLGGQFHAGNPGCLADAEA